MIDVDGVKRMFADGFDCSQVVLSESCAKIGMDREDAMKVASCFGVGMLQGSVCGAVTGALMAIGMRFGNYAEGDMTSKFLALSKREEFCKRFSEINGSVMCPRILGEEVIGMDRLMELSGTDLFYRDCPKYCVDALKILEDIL